MIHTICFFNHWHNGDVFSGKGYMLDIIKQLPEMKFQHAQLNSLKSMRDLPCEHIHTDSLPPQVTHQVRYIDVNGVFYINTWVGCYGNAVIPQGEQHANWYSLHRMWSHIMEVLHLNLTPNLQYPKFDDMDSIMRYIPESDWSAYDISPALSFAAQHNRMVLVCNGKVRSTQSHIGLMQAELEALCHDFPDVAFVCTTKFEHPGWSNLYFTDDIFANVQDGDINEIAFLSTRCEMIIGKNSGPFMFCHVKENILDPNKAFFSLSHRPSDSYACHMSGLPCRYYHYSEESAASVAGYIRLAMGERGQVSSGSMKVYD